LDFFDPFSGWKPIFMTLPLSACVILVLFFGVVHTTKTLTLHATNSPMCNVAIFQVVDPQADGIVQVKVWIQTQVLPNGMTTVDFDPSMYVTSSYNSQLSSSLENMRIMAGIEHLLTPPRVMRVGTSSKKVMGR
jgi:hypothetical protein